MGPSPQSPLLPQNLQRWRVDHIPGIPPADSRGKHHNSCRDDEQLEPVERKGYLKEKLRQQPAARQRKRQSGYGREQPRYTYSMSVILVMRCDRAPMVRSRTFSFIRKNLLLITAPASTTSPVMMLNNARNLTTSPSLSNNSLIVLRISLKSINETFG
jgi:hypothetical protein